MIRLPEVLTCVHRPPCPGCPGLGASALDPSQVAKLERLAERLSAPAPEPLWLGGRGYRHRARLSVRETAGGLRLGIFEEGSHRLVPIPECGIHHPNLTVVANLVEHLLRDEGIEAYDEGKHRGVVRAVQFVVERSSSKVQVTFVCRDRLGPGSNARAKLTPVLRALETSVFVHSLFLNAQPEKNNALMGDVFEKIAGPDCIRDDIFGTSIFYPPGAFGQANPAAHDAAVARIAEDVAPGAIVSELYAGTGSIGLGLTRSRTLRMNEIGPFSLEGLRLGIAALPEGSIVPSVHEGPAEACLSILEGADVVIVDPPRKGLSPQVVSELCRTAPKRLWYLSCGLDSFVRDAEALATHFSLERLTMLPYFPYTEHIETLAAFSAR